MSNQDKHEHEGTFAEGQADERAHPQDTERGDFAEGQEREKLEHEGTFAEGQATEVEHPENTTHGDFAEGER